MAENYFARYHMQPAQPAQSSPNHFAQYGGSSAGSAVSVQLEMLKARAMEQILLGNDAGYNSLMSQVFQLQNDLTNGTTFVGGQMQAIPGANAGAYARSQAEAAGTAAGNVPSSVQEYQYAVSQGYQGRYEDWERDARKASATTVNLNQGEGDKFYEVLDAKNAERWSGYSDAGMTAQRNITRIDRLETLLGDVQTGGTAAFKQWAGNFGINSEGLDDIQAAAAIINSLVPEQRPPGSGPMSDADLELFKQSLPRVINQPGGNTMILSTMRAVAAYDMEVGRIADAVSDRAMTPAEGRAAMSSLANPLDGWSGQVDNLAKGGTTTVNVAPSSASPAPAQVQAPVSSAPPVAPVAAPALVPAGMLAAPERSYQVDPSSGVPVGGEEQVYRPKTKAEYDAVPAGAVYVNRNGARAVKR